jgi:hypothetical protein
MHELSSDESPVLQYKGPVSCSSISSIRLLLGHREGIQKCTSARVNGILQEASMTSQAHIRTYPSANDARPIDTWITSQWELVNA